MRTFRCTKGQRLSSKQLNGSLSWQTHYASVPLHRIEHCSPSSTRDVIFSLTTSHMVDSFTILFFDVLCQVKMAFASHTHELYVTIILITTHFRTSFSYKVYDNDILILLALLVGSGRLKFVHENPHHEKIFADDENHEVLCSITK